MSSENRKWIPQAGDVLDTRYVLGEVLDEGGMGVVMRAEHKRMGRTVAVKLLHPDIALQEGYRRRFEREVQLATLLDHPHVVRCYDYGETEAGVLYLVMELLDGANLKEEMRKSGRLSTGRVIEVGLQLLDGMAAAHSHEVIHRDLKPGNIFLVKDYRGRDVVKILDFGMAKSLADEQRLTKAGTLLGTPAYLAPESLIRDSNEKRGDVYAIGLILLEMLLGQKVFSGSSIAETFVQQLLAPARIPRRIWDTPLGDVLVKALQKDPARRTNDGQEMLEQLTAAAPNVSDFTLEAEEIPPLTVEDVDQAILTDLTEGRITEDAVFKSLPEPQPFERASPAQAHAAPAAAVGAPAAAKTGAVPYTPPPEAEVAAESADKPGGMSKWTLAAIPIGSALVFAALFFTLGHSPEVPAASVVGESSSIVQQPPAPPPMPTPNAQKVEEPVEPATPPPPVRAADVGVAADAAAAPAEPPDVEPPIEEEQPPEKVVEEPAPPKPVATTPPKKRRKASSRKKTPRKKDYKHLLLK